MHGYFTSRRGDYQSARRTQLMQGVLLVLIVTVAVLAIMLIRQSAFRNDYEASIVRALRFEADAAVSQLNSLSRTGGSSTESVIGKVRQHVYAIRILSGQYDELNGRNLVDLALLDVLTAAIDQYELRRQAGQATLEQQTSLAQGLEKLQNLADQIQ